MTSDEAHEIAKVNPGSAVMYETQFEVIYSVKLHDGTIIHTCKNKPQRTLEECERELRQACQEREQFRKTLAERTKQYLSLKDKFEVLLSEYKRVTNPVRPDAQKPIGELATKLEEMAKESGNRVIHSNPDGQ
jgi:hypothetical protein